MNSVCYSLITRVCGDTVDIAVDSVFLPFSVMTSIDSRFHGTGPYPSPYLHHHNSLACILPSLGTQYTSLLPHTLCQLLSEVLQAFSIPVTLLGFNSVLADPFFLPLDLWVLVFSQSDLFAFPVIDCKPVPHVWFLTIACPRLQFIAFSQLNFASPVLLVTVFISSCCSNPAFGSLPEFLQIIIFQQHKSESS